MRDDSNRKKLIVGTGIYAVGTFGTRILMFLIAPLYTYYLATSEMGIYDVLISTISLLIPIISLQIADAVYRWIIRDDTNSRIYLRTTYQFLVGSSFFAIIVIVIVNRYVKIPYLYYFLGALITTLFFQISQKILRGLKRQWLFAISGIIYTIVFLILNIFQLCVLHRGVESLLTSYIVANILGLATIIAFEKRIRINIFSRLDTLKLKELLQFSIPLIPNYLSWWIIDSSDKFIVLLFLGIGSNGILAIVHKFPTILQSVFGLFTNSWQDLAVSSDKDEGDFFTSVFRKLYRILFSIIWLLVPATKLVVWIIMGRDYKIAGDYVPFYYMGAVFQTFCSFYGVGYLRSKNTKGAFSSSVYGALINAIVNISLVKLAGIQAAAVSTFVAFLVMWIIRERQNRQELNILVNWKEIWIFVIVDVIICVITIYSNLVMNFVFSICGMIGCAIFNFKEIKSAISMIKSKRERIR